MALTRKGSTATTARRPTNAVGSAVQAQKTDLVNMATLSRGRVYVYRSVPYYKDVPMEVDDKIADELEAITHEVVLDGEVLERPFFHIERDVPRSRLTQLQKPPGPLVKKMRLPARAS